MSASAAAAARSSTAPELQGDRGETMRRLLGYLRPYRAKLIVIALLIVTATIAWMAGPWLLGVAIDKYISEGNLSGLRGITLVMGGTYLTSWVCMTIYMRLSALVAQQVLRELREELFANLQRLSLGFFDRASTGELMSRLTSDVTAVDQLLSQQLVGLARSVAALVGVLGFMLALDWRLTLLAIAPFPFVIWVGKTIGQKTKARFRAHQQAIATLTGVAEEQISAQRVIVAFDGHREAIDEFSEANQRVRDTGVHAQTLTMMLMPLSFGMGNLSVALVAGVGGLMAVAGWTGVTVGLIAAFVNYAQRVGQPLSQVGNAFPAIVTALAGAERVFALIDEEPTVTDAPSAPRADAIKGRVVFDHVDFEYEEGRPILRDVSLVAEPGQTIGLVGPTGAGKTTIINVLARFYDIASGSVTIDGVDIRSVSQDSLREQIGVVLQDTFLFNETVRENIRYGRLNASDDEVEFAAALANADRFIRRLPEGYDTILVEGANNLSLGQRQVLAIARAILADPAILILDEATSSVDTRTEAVVQEALLRLMSGRTSFVIAHRLSTVRDADQILVIDDGRVVEQGTHDQLMASEGAYWRLYESQFHGVSG